MIRRGVRPGTVPDGLIWFAAAVVVIAAVHLTLLGLGVY